MRNCPAMPIALAVLLALSLLAGQVFSLPVVIPNPGAEVPKKGQPSAPALVSSYLSPGTTGQCLRDTSVFHTGRASFYLNNKGPRSATFIFDTPAVAGLSYTVTAWVRTRNAEEVSIRVRLTNQKGNWINGFPLEAEKVTGTQDWTKLTTTWTATAGAANSKIFLRASGPGEAWFDDVQVSDDFEDERHIARLRSIREQLARQFAGVDGWSEPFAQSDLRAIGQVLQSTSAYEKFLIGLTQRPRPVPQERQALLAAVTADARKAELLCRRLSGLRKSIDQAKSLLNVTELDHILGWASPACHVFLRDCPVSFQAQTTGRILAVKGETEAIQLVILPLAEDIEHIKDVSVEVGELRGPAGVIPTDAVDVHPVGFVKITTTPARRLVPLEYEYLGWWPDPLLENFPFSVRRSDTQPVWISVRVPPTQPPGTYKGHVTVRVADVPLDELPLEIEIADFELPDSNPWAFKNVLSFWPRWPEQFYKEKWTPELEQKFFDFLLDRRINITSIYGNEPYENLDRFKEFAARGQNVLMLHHTSRFGRPSPDSLRSRLDKFVPELKKVGLIDRAYMYGWDELEGQPDEWEYYKIIDRSARIMLNEYDGVKLILTGSGKGPYQYGLGDLFKGLSNICYCPFMTYDFQAARRAHANGNEVWWYDTDWIIDQHLIRSRLIPWQTFKLEADGFLIWCINRWKANDRPIGRKILTDWNPFLDGQCPNSSGMYVYPGLDGPVSSLRLENFADGIEDFELLTAGSRMLANLISAQADPESIEQLRRALVIDDELTAGIKQYTTDPEILFDHRRRLINALVAAKDSLANRGRCSQADITQPDSEPPQSAPGSP